MQDVSQVNEWAARHGLGNRAEEFLGAMTNHIQRSEGGVHGFFERIRMAGFAETLDDWVGSRPTSPVSGALVANLFGTGFLGNLAEAFEKPLDQVVDAVSGGTPIAIRRVASKANQSIPTFADQSGLRERPAWVWAVLAVGVLAGVVGGVLSCGQQNMMASTASYSGKPTTSSSQLVQPMQSVEANAPEGNFMLSPMGNGAFSYEGQVASNLVAKMTTAMETGLSKDTISGALIGGEFRAFGWMDKFPEILALMKSEAISLSAQGEHLVFSGEVADPNWMNRLKALFEGTEIKVSTEAVKVKGAVDAPAPKPTVRSSEAAQAALAELGTDFTATDLVNALNLSVINFRTGSSTIDTASMALLQKAAEAINRAPAGTRIEVGGHTDNMGSAATNQSLSLSRAQAVVRALKQMGVSANTLTYAGFGSTKPIADNKTQGGRAQNRRMEFKLLP